MSRESLREYIKIMQMRYKNATKKQKGYLLTEITEVGQISRKHAMRLMNGGDYSVCLKRGPRRKYDDRVIFHLRRLWEAMNRMCGKRMVSALPLWLGYDEHPELDDELRKALVSISSSSIDRLLRPFKKCTKGLSATKPGKFLKTQIPLELLDGQVKEPGYVEADTVAHCGDSLSGSFSSTLTITDLFSGWTENTATHSKKSKEIVDGIKDIRRRMPFGWKGFACDNGTEFINRDLFEYLVDRPDRVKFTRRRPYKKNDAAHVEQKNDTHVRQIFGYERIDHPELIDLMNEIYRDYWNPLLNYFCPAMKLKHKQRIGAKVRKFYDTPKTPCDRLLESKKLTPLRESKLRLKRNELNPFVLQQGLQDRIQLFRELLRKTSALIYDQGVA